LVPERLHDFIGTYELMLVAAGGLAVSTAIYWVIDRRERHERDPAGIVTLVKPEAVHPVGREGGFSLVLHDRYLRLVGLMVLVGTVINATGEYVVGKMVTSTSAQQLDPAAYIQSFYSSYYTVVNIVSAVIQGLVVSRVIGKLGVRKAMFITPIIVVGGWLAFLAFASLATIRITKTTENSVDYSLHNTIRQALYLPTSRESKYKAKAAIDTFFFRMGDMIAGLGVVFVVVNVLGLGVHAFAIMNLALGALWLWLAARAGKLHDVRTKERAARAALGIRETAT
jgi:AAA family ATP:ADP antiporter